MLCLESVEPILSPVPADEHGRPVRITETCSEGDLIGYIKGGSTVEPKLDSRIAAQKCGIPNVASYRCVGLRLVLRREWNQ